MSVDSRYDLLFETNTLILVIYLAYISRGPIRSNRLIKYGIGLLIFNSFYEVVTEITFFNDMAAAHPMTDSLMEDGLLQLSFLFFWHLASLNWLTRQKKNAMLDELTGLHNRKKLHDIQLETFDLVFFIDLDGLKAINDSEGHLVGDMLIARFANVLKQTVHPSEQAFRIGGDEFVVLCLPERGQSFVATVKEALIAEPIKFSYGIEHSNRTSLFEAIERTDKAMYEMKKTLNVNVERFIILRCWILDVTHA
ncbi:GGDEF domain-containing protein [Vibrio sinaloensis]|nr:GGDEF domain-containing protein [Vibrio sinaloensis]